MVPGQVLAHEVCFKSVPSMGQPTHCCHGLSGLVEGESETRGSSMGWFPLRREVFDSEIVITVSVFAVVEHLGIFF